MSSPAIAEFEAGALHRQYLETTLPPAERRQALAAELQRLRPTEPIMGRGWRRRLPRLAAQLRIRHVGRAKAPAIPVKWV